jgi:hypothetical protein
VDIIVAGDSGAHFLALVAPLDRFAPLLSG